MADVVNDIGPHRIFCGDATNPEHVARLFDGVKPSLMVTDPPYGVDYDATWRRKWRQSSIEGAAEGKVLNDDRADWRDAWMLFPGSVAYVYGPVCTPVALEAAGLRVRAEIIWVKPRPVISRGNYHWQHEICHYAVRPAVCRGRHIHAFENF
jgi:DNA modification methylase